MAKINYNMLEKGDYFYKLLTINNSLELEEFIRLYDTYNLLDNYKNNLVKISNPVLGFRIVKKNGKGSKRSLGIKR